MYYALYYLIVSILDWVGNHIYGVFIFIVAVVVISALLAKSMGRKITITTKPTKKHHTDRKR